MDGDSRWEWLSGILVVTLGWLAKRRLRKPDGVARSIADIANAKRQLEICEAEREYYRRALEEILRITESRYRTLQHQPLMDAPREPTT
mgnify:CR=1 FL=1